jgi:hypothetical protein
MRPDPTVRADLPLPGRALEHDDPDRARRLLLVLGEAGHQCRLGRSKLVDDDAVEVSRSSYDEN